MLDNVFNADITALCSFVFWTACVLIRRTLSFVAKEEKRGISEYTTRLHT
jgi:hypothetical protein